MTGSRRTRVFPLTAQWYLATWRSKYRLRAKTIRTSVDGRQKIIGFAATVLGFTVALGVFSGCCHTTHGWYRDFGHRFGRYTIGGWRTVRRVPVSTGWAFGGDGSRIGCTVTVASRTLMFAKLATRADLHASCQCHRPRSFWTEKRVRLALRAVTVALVALDVVLVALAWCLWPVSYLVTAAYTVWVALTWVKRPHFLDVGRFTAGVWRVHPGTNTPILGLFWARHGAGPKGPKAGLELVIGGYGMAAFALMPRSEWPAYKQAKAERRARRKELEA
ncbi:hypothetical protein [Streptomyces sp. NPDC001068]|uniref:hypothetical protein n=1 Tax=Streptomyces sp. NPDC001068 TaxID=3364544 RepID=UPI003676F4B4